MDQLASTFNKNHLNSGLGNVTEKNSYSQTKALIEIIELHRYLIQNQDKLEKKNFLKKYPSWNAKLQDLAINIKKATIEVRQRTFDLTKQRSHFIQFQQKAEVDRTAAKFLKTNVKRYLEYMLATQISEFTSKILIANQENEMRKKRIQNEAKSLEFHLKSAAMIHDLRKTDLYHTRFKTKKQYLDQLAKYDENIEKLYACKISLLVDKDSIEKEYVAIQNQLIGQRSLYNRLKEEHKQNVTKAFIGKLENFRRNRAARLIQQNWRSYCARVSAKKRKSRK
ncbi:uncharacterized protein LOC128885758 isoform X1 [Hylaeus anthracinus]|uniref:uncharacterized protein LOC128885758 isoform X1 n=1 Tax=Hylaeus anthracinus TaxID=313031 RepID=UPI0023B8B55F|nr:uncharacterized protein LOC128885758 isoform X1 [Hylaeus anthracinus]